MFLIYAFINKTHHYMILNVIRLICGPKLPLPISPVLEATRLIVFVLTPFARERGFARIQRKYVPIKHNVLRSHRCAHPLPLCVARTDLILFSGGAIELSRAHQIAYANTENNKTLYHCACCVCYMYYVALRMSLAFYLRAYTRAQCPQVGGVRCWRP